MTGPEFNHDARAEDVRFMAAHGESAARAAARLGLSIDGLSAWCKKRGGDMEEALAQMMERNPVSVRASQKTR